jgi:phage terminase small subunit
MPRANKSERDGLTMKQRKFVNAYCESGNATESAIKAGYSPDAAHVQGSRLLKNIKIQKSIEAKEKEFEMASLITKEKILSEILNIAEDKEATRSEKLNALKLLGQHLAMFTDKQIVQTEQGNPFENLSDEEIMKMAEESQRFKKQG